MIERTHMILIIHKSPNQFSPTTWISKRIRAPKWESETFHVLIRPPITSVYVNTHGICSRLFWPSSEIPLPYTQDPRFRTKAHPNTMSSMASFSCLVPAHRRLDFPRLSESASHKSWRGVLTSQGTHPHRSLSPAVLQRTQAR